MKREEVYKEIETYYREHRVDLIKQVIGRAGSKAAAEDIVQEAFTRALTYYNSYVPGIYEFGAWFHRILNNAAKDYIQTERNRGMMVDVADGELEGPRIDQYKKLLLKEIVKMIEAKPVDTRHILHLYFIEQYKPADIAKIVPVSNGAIRAVVHRFRVEVKDKYGERLGS